MIKVIVRFLSAVLVFIMGFCMGCSWIFKGIMNLLKINAGGKTNI